MGEIRHQRLLRGMSTTALAHRLGVAQSSVVRLERSEERGAITLERLKRAAEALGCTLAYRFIPARKTKTASASRQPVNKKAARVQPTSKLAQAMRQDEYRASARLNPQERIERVCELSDLLRSLRQ